MDCCVRTKEREKMNKKETAALQLQCDMQYKRIKFMLAWSDWKGQGILVIKQIHDLNNQAAG